MMLEFIHKFLCSPVCLDLILRDFFVLLFAASTSFKYFHHLFWSYFQRKSQFNLNRGNSRWPHSFCFIPSLSQSWLKSILVPFVWYFKFLFHDWLLRLQQYLSYMCLFDIAVHCRWKNIHFTFTKSSWNWIRKAHSSYFVAQLPLIDSHHK